jgi:hypothetical protein
MVESEGTVSEQRNRLIYALVCVVSQIGNTMFGSNSLLLHDLIWARMTRGTLQRKYHVNCPKS